MYLSAEGAQTGSPYKDQSLSSMEPNPYEGKSGRKPNAETQANYFKLRLLECVAGLDRGFAANAYAAMQVESAALALTEQSEPVMLSWTSGADPSLLKQQIMAILNHTQSLFCPDKAHNEVAAHAAPASTSTAVPMAMTVSTVLLIHVRLYHCVNYAVGTHSQGEATACASPSGNATKDTRSHLGDLAAV